MSDLNGIVQPNTEQPNSVEISINAKLMYSGKVKCYGKTISDAMEQAVIKAEQLEQLIKKKNG